MREVILVSIILLLSVLPVMAENLTINETIDIDKNISETIDIDENITINETIPKEEPICEEQLEICVENYNFLLEDYQAGEHCGTIVPVLRNLNKDLGEERDICREEVGENKLYKTGFYILFIILLMASITIIFNSFKSKKQGG